MEMQHETMGKFNISHLSGTAMFEVLRSSNTIVVDEDPYHVAISYVLEDENSTLVVTCVELFAENIVSDIINNSVYYVDNQITDVFRYARIREGVSVDGAIINFMSAISHEFNKFYLNELSEYISTSVNTVLRPGWDDDIYDRPEAMDRIMEDHGIDAIHADDNITLELTLTSTGDYGKNITETPHDPRKVACMWMGLYQYYYDMMNIRDVNDIAVKVMCEIASAIAQSYINPANYGMVNHLAVLHDKYEDHVPYCATCDGDCDTTEEFIDDIMYDMNMAMMQMFGESVIDDVVSSPTAENILLLNYLMSSGVLAVCMKNVFEDVIVPQFMDVIVDDLTVTLALYPATQAGISSVRVWRGLSDNKVFGVIFNYLMFSEGNVYRYAEVDHTERAEIAKLQELSRLVYHGGASGEGGFDNSLPDGIIAEYNRLSSKYCVDKPGRRELNKKFAELYNGFVETKNSES